MHEKIEKLNYKYIILVFIPVIVELLTIIIEILNYIKYANPPVWACTENKKV